MVKSKKNDALDVTFSQLNKLSNGLSLPQTNLFFIPVSSQIRLLCLLSDSSDRSLEACDLGVYRSNAKYVSGISCEIPLSVRERGHRSGYMIRQQET